jgi:hypothetical protein
MKKKYLVWGAIATIGAILIYNWKKSQDADDRKNDEAEDVDKGTPKSESVSQQNTSNTGSTTPQSTSGVPAGLNVEKFQLWVWNRVEKTLPKVSSNPDTYNSMLCSGACTFDTAVDGKWGQTGLSKTSLAWEKYKQYWDISKNQPTAEGDKKFPKDDSKTSASTTQAKLNKDTMDKLYMTWGGNASAKKATHSKGRDLQVFFEVSGQVLMPYRWSIIFYEYAKGESRPTYTITDGEGKTYQRGNFSFNGSKYDFSATQGTGARQRAVTSTSLITALNSLTKRDASLA